MPRATRLACMLAALAFATLAVAPPDAAAASLRRRATRAARPAELPVTGWYGPLTVAAVKRYQAMHRLPVTGVADPRTLRSLGLVMGGAIFPGSGGPRVRHLQLALRHHERQIRRSGLVPRPPRSTPTPRPYWTPPAAPFPPRETPAPAVEPPSAPLPTPAPASEEPLAPAWLELYGGAWTAPVPPGGPGALWLGGGALWLGDWGLAGEYASAPELGGQLAGDLIDAQLRFRGLGPLWLGLGYRGLAGEHLGAAGLGLDLPLGADWLRLRAAATAGSNFGSGWAADGRGGLALVLGPVVLEGGYRALAADGVGGLAGMGSGHGAYGAAGLRF